MQKASAHGVCTPLNSSYSCCRLYSQYDTNHFVAFIWLHSFSYVCIYICVRNVLCAVSRFVAFTQFIFTLQLLYAHTDRFASHTLLKVHNMECNACHKESACAVVVAMSLHSGSGCRFSKIFKWKWDRFSSVK